MVDDDDAVGQRHRFGDIMGDQNSRECLLLPDAFQQMLHLDAGQRIERAERLVECQNVGVGDKRAGKGHALALAAGQNGGPFFSPVGKADLVENGERLFAGFRALGYDRSGRPRHFSRSWPRAEGAVPET
jgi:hypothetical protein